MRHNFEVYTGEATQASSSRYAFADILTPETYDASKSLEQYQSTLEDSS